MLLITGATGYIGKHLVWRLDAQGMRPRCLVRTPKKAAQLFPSGQAKFISGDTTQPETLAAAMEGIDTIVHAAFLTADRKEQPGNTYEGTNVQGTANLIRAAEAAGVKRMIEISGLGTRPDKAGSYMQGRYLAEKMLKESNLDWTIIRPSVVFGKEAPFIKGLADLIRSSFVVPLIDGGKTLFQPIYVEDVVTTIIQVLGKQRHSTHATFTLGGPDYYSFTEMIDMLMQAMNHKCFKVPMPMFMARMGATAMELTSAKPMLTRAALTLFTFDNTTELNSVEAQFGFAPLSLRHFLEEEGV